MRLDDYDEREDSKRVWLSVDEMERLIEQMDTPQQRVACMLAGKSGLRRDEVVSVRFKDFDHAPDGFVRIWNDVAKQDHYREAPIPDEVQYIVETLAHGSDPEESVVGVVGTTVYRWVQRAAEQLQDETGDEAWSYLDVHDLRRSWGGHLLWNCGVMPTVVMEFGGWTDWDTFAEHYMGQITPEAAERERGKIDYMGGDPAEEETPFTPRTPAAQQTYGSNS